MKGDLPIVNELDAARAKCNRLTRERDEAVGLLREAASIMAILNRPFQGFQEKECLCVNCAAVRFLSRPFIAALMKEKA